MKVIDCQFIENLKLDFNLKQYVSNNLAHLKKRDRDQRERAPSSLRKISTLF